MADSWTGYCYSMRPYVGEKCRLITTVDLLLGDLKGKGYHLYMDNFYNSVQMTDHLQQCATHVCGTLRKNRGAPPVINKASVTTLKKGEFLSRHNGKVLVTAWRDKKVVKVLTTVHEDKMVNVTQRQKGHRHGVTVPKPVAVEQYNKYMNGVDRLDQMISYYPLARRSYKWYKKFCMYLFSIAMYNSFILYRAAKEDSEKKEKLLNYVLSVCTAWGDLRGVGAEGEVLAGAVLAGMEEEQEAQPGPSGVARAPQMSDPEQEAQPGPSGVPRAPRMSDPGGRLRGRLAAHTMLRYPPTEKKNRPQRKCRVCARNNSRRDTRYYCKECNVPLCQVPCFQDFHSKKNYKK